MDIKQGDIYWLLSASQEDATVDYSHPYVIIQDDIINRSRIKTVVACALTSNLKRVTEPGNLMLDDGEANLPKQSVVVVSQIETVDKEELGEYIGSLSLDRVKQIFSGMKFQQASYFSRFQSE